MKIIVDTNILVSAIIRNNLPEDLILWLVEQTAVEWIATEAIVKEYIEVLQRKKFNLPAEIIEQWHYLLLDKIQLITTDVQVDFPRDRKDAKFLECALASKADVFVTGDKDFSEAQTLVATRIMTVAQFKAIFMI